LHIVKQILARTWLALIGLPVVYLTALGGGYWLLFFAAFITLVGMAEIYAGARQRGMRPLNWLGYGAALAWLIVTEFFPEQSVVLSLGIVLATMALSLVLSFRRREFQGVLSDAAVTLFAAVYIGLGMTIYVRLCELAAAQPENVHYLSSSVSALFLVLIPVWTLDTVAFTVGKAFGKTKLVPRLSPGKTVEGGVAGFAAALTVAMLVGTQWNHLPWGYALLLGLLIAFFATLGDLAESIMKRDLGFKDFGTIFGPHGGVLDRFDGILFALPVAYFYLWWIIFGVTHGG
jgi:phosphatidate cytidylyltransferase